jgi:lipoprotein NlpI
MRAGREDALSEFARDAERLDRDEWPWPIVGLFLGLLNPEDVQTAARSADDPNARRDQVCAADFYIGLYQVEKRAQAEARPLLRSVAEKCSGSLAAVGAKLELKRLR